MCDGYRASWKMVCFAVCSAAVVVSATGAQDPALQVLRIAVRPDVDQLGREVGIGRGRGCIQLDHYWPCHLEVLGQRLTRIHEYVLPRFHLPLVVDADQTRERVQT